ncbi:MAG: inositol monophosphatase [Alphaproteobacteria bacterium]|nr:inositol monophosphatase [Alphaproteobacteria bacterium]
MAYLSPVLTLLIGAIKKTAGALARDFNELEHLQNGVHGDSSFALRSAERTERVLKEELSKIKGGYPVVVNNNDVIPASGNYFLLCPIDGFANFAHANNNFAISVALVEKNAVIDAVTYNPISDEMFFAEKGCGAFKEGFRNHERLRIAGCKHLEKSLIYCNSDIDLLQKVCQMSKNIIVSGSVSLDLAYLAAGKSDAVVSSGNTPAALAAGILLVKEAGGYIFGIGETDIRSEDLNKALFSGNIVATNEALRQKIADKMA